MNVNIIYEDKDILVVEKPAGMPVQSGKTIEMDLLNYLRNYVSGQSQPGALPYMGLIHRLDKPVGGVMVLARHKSAAGDLSEQTRNQKMTKKYVAVTEGLFQKKSGSMSHYVAHEKRGNISVVVNEQHPLAKKALLQYRVLDETVIDGRDLSLAEVELVTGRHHQIRVQMAAEGHSLWGDRKYNNQSSIDYGHTGIALFAFSLAFFHPRSGERMSFKLPCPDWSPYNQFNSNHIESESSRK